MDLFHKMFGPTKAELEETTRKRIEQEARRGSKEAAAAHLKRAERDYERDPSPLNKAGVERARRNMG